MPLNNKELTLHYCSANHFQLGRSSDIILPALVAETTTEQHLMNICSSSSTTVENEQIIRNYIEELSSTSSDSQSSEEFDDILSILLSSPSASTSPDILANSSQRSPKADVACSPSRKTPSTISKTIVVSHLPAIVNSQRLRRWFPGCRKIVFKKSKPSKKNLRFALVEHGSYDDAQRNLTAFITSPLMAASFRGVQAKYMAETETKSKRVSRSLTTTNSLYDLHVGCIPGLVTSQQLRILFPYAVSIDYRQGKITRKRVKLGFAVLHFTDIQLAAQVIQNADQYFIDNQLLSITYRLLQNTTTNTTDNSECL